MRVRERGRSALTVLYRGSRAIGAPSKRMTGRLLKSAISEGLRLGRWAVHERNAERWCCRPPGGWRGAVVARRTVVVARGAVAIIAAAVVEAAIVATVVAAVAIAMEVVVAGVRLPVVTPPRVKVLAGTPVILRHRADHGPSGTCR